MEYSKLDLKTLKEIKHRFNLFSDHSRNCLGYKSICDEIEKIEKENKETRESRSCSCVNVLLVRWAYQCKDCGKMLEYTENREKEQYCFLL